MAAQTKARRYQRIGLPRGLFIAWQAAGVRVVSRVATLGMGGLFIRVPDPPSQGESLKMYFEVPGGDVRARGVVRSSLPGKGMGVEFTFMASEGRARLRRLLQRLLKEFPVLKGDLVKPSTLGEKTRAAPARESALRK